MRFVVIDFETYYDQEYTLSKLSTETYIRDPRFEVHGAAIKWSADHAAKWYDARILKQVLKEEPWGDVFLIAHHAQFDGLILAHHFGVVPAVYGCTLSMARLVLGNHLSVSLDAVRQHFGMPVKSTPYSVFKGKKWHTLTSDEQRQLAEGCCNEVESIYKIFTEMGRVFPREEYAVVDATIRMFTQPVLHADTALLEVLWQEEEKSKQAKMQALSVSEAVLQSATKFESLIRAEGVEIEYKMGKNDSIPCFAKTDEFMRGLLEHDNERVRLLAQARLGVKSTLLQTRAETLRGMAGRGSLPVYLRYCGAHTTRWSGGDKVNWQNFKRGSALRKAILAPPGYLLGVIDLSQIEARILAYIAGQDDLVEQFRRKEDVYCNAASGLYGRTITKDDPDERGTGKQLVLSCGFGCGAAKFQATAKLGIYGPPIKISLAEAQRAVEFYRSKNSAIVEYWKVASRMIARLAGGPPCRWGPMEVRDGKIYGPGGTWLDYTTLMYYKDGETGDSYWRVRKRNGWTKLYGGKLVENCVQWLARIVLSQAMLRIIARGFRVVTTSHDEIVVLIPDDNRAPTMLEWCRQEMARTPNWLSDIPLDAEATMGERYSK